VQRTVTLSIILFIQVLCSQTIDYKWFTDINGENNGHTTCAFLNLPVAAAHMGAGTASYSGAMDATDLPFYTANSALADRYRFAFSHNEWLMGLRKEYLGALFPVLDVGTFGAYLQVFTPGAFDNARDIDEQPTTASYLEYTLGATYARAFLQNKLSAGLAVAFVESRIEELTGRTICGNFDMRYSPAPFVSGHLRLSSFGKSIAYREGIAEPLPAQAGLSLRIAPLPPSHPLRQYIDLTLGAGVSKTADEPVHAGAHTRIAIKQYGALTTGYDYVKGADASVNGLSVGTEVTTGAFTLSGAWRYLSPEFGPVWAVTLLHDREELKARTAEDYYQIALKHYNKKRHTLCIRNAKRALRLDPNMWKAHALLSRLNSDILRKKRREIAIVYTGNAQGVFTNPSGAKGLGGFARQATIINTIRVQFPLTVTLEAGNMLPLSAEPHHSTFTRAYLDYITYDAVAGGSAEMLYGIPKLYKGTENRFRYIVSNSASPTPGIVKNATIEREGYRFFIASFVGQSQFSSDKQHLVGDFDNAAFENIGRDATVRILIVHDTWENIRSRAEAFASFDIIICGSLEQRFPTPMRIGKQYICSAGSKGEYVGNLILRFDEARTLSGVENRLIPVQSDINPDSVIAGKIAAFARSATNVTLPPGTVKSTDGAFVFMSDRDGKPGIYCKVTDDKAEYPLTREIIDTCDNPVCSFTASSIACRARSRECSRLMLMRFDGSSKRYVADNLQVRDATFTPDGTWLYYAAGSCTDTLTDLYRTKSEGGPSYPIVTWPNSVETAPAFSSDGTAMVFGSNRDGSMQLYLTNLDAELPVRITDEAANYTAPVFSPDGAYVAYLSDVTNFAGRRDLWIFERKGGTHRRITQKSNVKEFCWLQDSRTIIFTMGAMTFELMAVDVTNYRYHKVVQDTVKQWNERSPQTLTLNGKEHILYVRHYPHEKETQLYRVLPDGSENTRVVSSPGRDWLFMRE